MMVMVLMMVMMMRMMQKGVRAMKAMKGLKSAMKAEIPLMPPTTNAPTGTPNTAGEGSPLHPPKLLHPS